MTYVISDIHGNYEKYQAALQGISFQERDILYVLGDVIDRGEDSMKILLDMMCRTNVLPLVGNHEFMALSLLPKLMMEISQGDPQNRSKELLLELHQWAGNGGEKTLASFRQLSPDDQEAILDYLGEFEFYHELHINGQDYVLSHAGINNFDPDKALEDYSPHDLVFKRMDYSKPCYSDKILISGHTPTRIIHGKDEIYRGNNHIAIDCGCGWGGPLAVLCLETGNEFYAKG